MIIKDIKNKNNITYILFIIFLIHSIIYLFHSILRYTITFSTVTYYLEHLDNSTLKNHIKTFSFN